MNLKTLMIIKAVVCLGLGLLLLVAPTFGFSLFGASVTGDGTFPAQEYGAAMLGTMLLTWFARNAVESQARRAIILDLFIYDAIGVVITLIAISKGMFNLLGWGILAIYLFFTLGYGYFWFAKPAPVAQPAKM
ncbi:MAG TPA: hypothetical protein VLD65_12695 [Anaerolineales bacterium]|nr:hypothetical protein [Anaerolineales bacterium]